jgi:dienelactone hydrolase
MNTQSVAYEADGLQMIGHLAWTAPEPRPGVLVFPDAGGLGEHAKARAERLASEFGYAAMACDLYGQQEVLRDFNEVQVRLQPIRTIGFCFGGTLTYELALTGADIKAAIGFHSGLTVTSPGDSPHIRAKVLALFGADDPSIPAADRSAFERMLRAGNVDWQMTLYGGVVHAFTNPNADRLGRPEFARYDAKADARSWTQMKELLAEVFR